MKKTLILVTLLITAFTLTGCTEAQQQQLKMMTSENTLSALAYISTSFLDEQVEVSPELNGGILRLSNTDTGTDTDTSPTTEVEEELDQVNIYLDKLKSFMSNGTEQFGSITEQVSDNELYSKMIVISVDSEEFVLYYNIDVLSNEITGIFILDGVEYQVVAQNDLADAEDFEADIDDDEDDELDKDEDDEDDELDKDEDDEEDEIEYGMELVATNGTDSITIKYEVEIEDDENSQEFMIVKDIAGIVSELSIEIEQEEDEFKLSINDGNLYEFKVELEDDETEYKLEYEVDGVKGEIKITEYINELGETVYEYEIEEDGNHVEVEKDDPDEDDDEDEDDEELEETSNNL